MPRPPKLSWVGAHSSDYIVQSEIVRGEPRIYYAIVLGSYRHNRWTGPSRRTEAAAKIDAEYHAAGKWSERPPCFSFTL